MKLNKKMTECFKPHVVMHSIFALGLGLLLAALVPSLANIWLGLVLMAIGFVWDLMRK